MRKASATGGRSARTIEPAVIRVGLKRAYDAPARTDGYRVLVDRVWPRGRTKEELSIRAWLRDLGPSTALRTWFGHDPAKWEEFQERYRRELGQAEQRRMLAELAAIAEERRVTLVYGAHDEIHNQAVVIRDVLLAMIGRRNRPGS